MHRPYPIPFDHSAGKLLKLMDRHPYRPAHIHVRASRLSPRAPASWLTPAYVRVQYYVEAPGHKTLVTQVFPHDSDYLKVRSRGPLLPSLRASLTRS